VKKLSTGLLTSLRDRRVSLRGRITKPSASCCIARLLVLAADYPQQPILMQIDTPGGSIAESLLIISTMKGLNCPVSTVCQGEVGGAAALIAAQGSMGLRRALPSAKFSFRELLNEPSLSPENQQLLAAMLAQSTRKTTEETLGWLTAGAEFSPEEAIGHGLIDEIALP
jgi:ATP-dependent protease ClpP protease subunit